MARKKLVAYIDERVLEKLETEVRLRTPLHGARSDIVEEALSTYLFLVKCEFELHAYVRGDA